LPPALSITEDAVNLDGIPVHPDLYCSSTVLAKNGVVLGVLAAVATQRHGPTPKVNYLFSAFRPPITAAFS
jgi:hypothetical protein